MKDAICAFIMILITAFMVGCATPMKAQLPAIAPDDAMLEKLIDEPKTEQDLLHNSIVLEHLYINQKLQSYTLLEYIATLANDSESKAIYAGKIENIKDIYDMEL